MIRVLITGASGFIGRHCLARLGHEDCAIDAVNRTGCGPGGGRVRWHAADLRDPCQASRIVAALRPTHLLHLAWEATPRLYSWAPDNMRWLTATVALASAFGAAGGARFVGAGSSAEYAIVEWPCREDSTPVAPASIYGKCKAACRLAVEAAAQQHGFAAAWGRVFLPYGPGDPQGRLIPSVLAALDDRRPVETTHGRQLRDFIYAPDIADLLVRLLLSEETGAFNIATGKPTAIRSVVEHLAARCGGSELLRFGAIEPASGEPAVLVADMSKVEARLGWSAPTAIEAGLDRVLADRQPAISASRRLTGA
jgi:nucleoside-diphosphate-sugar epimerase